MPHGPSFQLLTADSKPAKRSRMVVGATRSTEVLGWSPRFPSFREGAETAYREWREGRDG